MKRLILSLFFAGLLLAGGALAAAPNVDACTSCHGLDGRSRDPDIPNLAGQKKNYLAKALRDFRIGERQQLMMNFLAKSMSDEDIENYAKYYASFP
jgi:cytochrome c553